MTTTAYQRLIKHVLATPNAKPTPFHAIKAYLADEDISAEEFATQHHQTMFRLIHSDIPRTTIDMFLKANCANSAPNCVDTFTQTFETV